MKTLFPAQQEAHDFFLSRHLAGLSTLDTSETGCGKTVTACRLMRTLGVPFGVVAPKAVLPQWQRAAADEGLEPVFILSYQKLNAGKTPWFSKELRKRGKGKARFFKWMNLPENFTLIWDEVHNASAPYSGNAIAHILATTKGVRSHNLSATAAEDPTDMRALGYALGLHRLDAAPCSWFSWLRKLGCNQDPWRQWHAGKETLKRMVPLRESLYRDRVFKIRRTDMPEAFRRNTLIEEPVDCGDIDKVFAAGGFTPEIIMHYLEGEAPEGEENFIVELLRARQLAEAEKVPVFIQMIRDLLAEGFSVPVFVCFRDTLRALKESFPEEMGIVQGGDDPEERQAAVDAFNSGRSRLLGLNIAAGGTGLSLHDMTGERPRFSLISPDWSAKKMVQVFGRVDRAGMKSESVQKVVIAADSIEERVWKTVKRKMKNMEALLG